MSRPPPTAHHSATPVSNGETVVFVGGKDRCAEVIFLLDTVEMRWSSVDVATAGVDSCFRGRCMLHTAVAVAGLESHRWEWKYAR